MIAESPLRRRLKRLWALDPSIEGLPCTCTRSEEIFWSSTGVHHHRHRMRTMSKKNKKSTRVKQHVFDLKREKDDQERKAKKAEKQKLKVEKQIIKAENSMKVDSGISKVGKQIKKKSFKVGKARKFQLDATTKAKASQAMAMDIEK